MLSFLSAHWYMVVLAVLSGLYLFWPWISRRGRDVPQLTCPEAVTLLNRKQGLLLDVRSDKVASREGLVIPQARRIAAGELEGRVSEINKFQNRPVIVHGAIKRSAVASAAVLRKAGFTEVYVLEGGVDVWQSAGLPVKRIDADAAG